jgi:uncharacterized protein (TIGR00730 family)
MNATPSQPATPLHGDAPVPAPVRQRVCVFAASSGRIPARYTDAARELGRCLAASGATVVFGGGSHGCMGALADGALDAGGPVVGIMPVFMREREWAHPGVTDWVWTEDLSERQREMLRGTDAVVTLPGGCGTLEEVAEVLTLKRLGLFHGHVILLNQDGFWDPLVAWLDRCIAEGFMEPAHRRLWTVVPDVPAVLGALGGRG